MDDLHSAFRRTAARRRHLDRANLLRSLTLVINGVPNGINLGQGVCDLDPPRPLVDGAIASIDGGDRQLYTPYRGLPCRVKRQTWGEESTIGELRATDGTVLAASGCGVHTSGD